MSSSDSVPQDSSADTHLDVVLSPDDIAAVDAFFESPSGDSPRVFTSDSRPARVAHLLGLLEGNSFTHDQRESLVHATMARVSLQRHRERTAAATGLAPDTQFIPADEDALEALINAEFRLSHVPAAMRERAARHLALLGLLDSPLASGPVVSNSLVEATMARVQAATEMQEQRMAAPVRIAAERGGLLSFVRSREIVSVAAMLLVAAAMLTPLAQQFREYSRRTACASNMATAGVAFGQYAASNKDSLPLASPSRPGTLFWNVGKSREQSNSANLFVLRSANFASLEQLACAGQVTRECKSLGADAWDWPSIKQVSVSFQNMFAQERPRWSTNNKVVVLADASPVIRRAVLGQPIYPFENSANHRQLGQNVLWSDGSAEWLKTPVLPNNDNIWLPRPVEDFIAKMTQPREASPLHGTESPSAADDAFVAP